MLLLRIHLIIMKRHNINTVNMKDASSKRCACWHWCCPPDGKGILYFVRENQVPDM
jgi:hypothetical protein